MPETAIEYFKTERNKQAEPYRKFYDEAIEALELYGALMKIKNALDNAAKEITKKY